MKSNKLLSIFLCVIFLFTLLLGCSKDEENEHVHGFDTAASLAAFPPDTVMLRAGDLEFTWADLYVFLFRAASDLSYNFTQAIEWDEEYISDMTLAEVVMDYLSEQISDLLVFDYASNLLGFSLSEEDVEFIQEDIDMLIADAESVEEFEERLFLNGFYNLETFFSFRLRELIPWMLITGLYGDDFSDIADDVVAEYAESNDFMRAQHILLAFLRTEDGYSLQEIDDNKADLRAQMEGILESLIERKEDDNFFEFFEELMWEYSEDPGRFSSPTGYLFQPNDMVEAFSLACAALEPGQISNIVVTSYGYHILLRLPVDFDKVPISVASAGYDYSLRMLAVMEDFEAKVAAWREEMTVEFTPEFLSLNLSEIFSWCAHED